MSTHPDVIILYGPPGSGKGTQAHILKSKLTHFAHIDFGTQLRSFVKNTQSNNHDYLTAQKIGNIMKTGQPVSPELLRYVVEKDINSTIESGKGILLEGPGRTTGEAEWLSRFFEEKKLNVCIIHLLLTLEDILPRMQTRYYVDGLSQPFDSYQSALEHSPKGTFPYRRDDDDNIELVTKRYKGLYKDVFEDILFIYQHIAQAKIILIDASKSINEVSYNVESKLFTLFSFDN